MPGVEWDELVLGVSVQPRARGGSVGRALSLVLVLALAATACSVRPVDDPGLGDAPLTTRVLAADGSVIAEWHSGENRIPVSYDELPRHLIDAVVAIEDRRYWDHPGVDLAAVARAVAANVEAGDVVQGGSTITQQYIKNVLLSPDVDLERKAEELVLAIAVEETLSKEEILERYLNTVYLGSGAYGVGAASRRYFGVDVADLTLSQSATLAGAIRAPSITNPVDAPEAALERRNLVLDVMRDEGWIGAEQHVAALGEPLALNVTDPINRYPYFSDEVRRRLLDDPRLGATPEERSALLFGGGLTIRTTLAPDHQDAALAAAANVMTGRAPEAAVVAIEPATGDVLALVGGRDFFSGSPGSQFNLATQGRRQPGSTMKPFVLAAALERGWAVDDTITGVARTTIQTPTGPWEVANYENTAFPDMTLADATAYSVNTAYATLIDSVGPEAVAEVAERTGVGSVDPVPSLALGTEEVSLLGLTSGYATFANEGARAEPRFVVSVTGPDGTLLLSNEVAATAVFDPSVAKDITATLTGVVSRGTGAQARIGRTTAGKTGTTQDSTDAWFVGYTPELVAGVWVGFPTSTRSLTYPATPHTITGGSWPAVIWSRFAVNALTGVPYSDMPTLDGASLVSVNIDPSDGTVIGPCAGSSSLQLSLGITTSEPTACDVAGVMPQTVGTPAGAAIERIAALGLPYSIEWKPDATSVTAGTVVGHEPAFGTRLDGSESIVVIIAGSPSEIPSLLGISEAQARETLQWLPVYLNVVVEDSDVGAPGTVWKQTPIAGDEASTTVTIWVRP